MTRRAAHLARMRRLHPKPIWPDWSRFAERVLANYFRLGPSANRVWPRTTMPPAERAMLERAFDAMDAGARDFTP